MEERLEQKHPKLHGIITAVLGITTMALTIAAILLIWAVIA